MYAFDIGLIDCFGCFIQTIRNIIFDIIKRVLIMFRKKEEKVQKDEKEKTTKNVIIENRFNSIIMSSKNIVAHRGFIYTGCNDYPYIVDNKVDGMIFDLNTKLWLGYWKYKDNYKGELFYENNISVVSDDFDKNIYVDGYLKYVLDCFVEECVIEDPNGCVHDDEIEQEFAKWSELQKMNLYNPSFSEVFYYFVNRYGVSFSKTVIPGIKIKSEYALEKEKRMLDEYDPNEDYELWGLWY